MAVTAISTPTVPAPIAVTAASPLTPAPAIRTVTRCIHCELKQYETANGNCRRCRLPLHSDVDAPVVVPVQSSSDAPAPTSALSLLSWLPTVIWYLRNKQGLSQSAMAVLLGVQRLYVCKLEVGGTIPGLANLYRIAGALSTTPEAVLRLCEWMRDGK